VTRNGEASIDDGKQQVGLAALAVDYRGSRLRWSLDSFTQREDIDEFRPQIGLTAGLASIPTPPPSRLNFYPGSNVQLRDTTTASRVEYDLNDALTAYADIGYRDGKAEQIFPVTTAGANALGNFTVRSTYYDSYTKTTSADTGLRARFATAGVGHTLTLGLSELRQEAGNAYVQGASTVASNLYNPLPLPAISAARTAPRKASETTLSSVALADTLAFADDRLLLTLGLRDQRVEMENFSTASGQSTSRYKASAVAPLAGIVFKPQANVALYGNYTDGLTRGQIVGATYANAGEVLTPYKSQQYEAGVKVDWGTLTTVASVFQIARPNGQVDAKTNIYGYDGEQRNRGLELSAYGEIQRGLRLMTSAVFNDAKLTSTAGGLNQGKDAPGVPQQTFNLGLDWDTPWIPALSMSARAIYTSSMFFDSANTLRVDGWTRYDIGARYSTSVAGKPVVLRANVENLFDDNNWLVSGTYLTVSAPRSFVLSASIDF
jgi:iron complex outermembrane receptor protein